MIQMVNNNYEITEIVKRASIDKNFRLGLVRQSLYWFLHIYFPEYLNFKIAQFHKEIINTLEDDQMRNYALAAFRGSGKSTIVSLTYVLWAMIGRHNKRFIVLISNTTKQSETLLYSIKDALERNDLLKSDLGPFQEESDEWKTASLIFKNYDAKIIATSVNESIRGVRYKSFRPQLIICDDVETLESVKSDEGKDKTVTWFDRDIIPLGDENTVVVVLGTIMSPGALLSTLIQRMQEGKMSGVFHRFPLIDEDNYILWRDRWPDTTSIEKFRKDMGIVEKSWQTEYLLNAWTEENQVISSKMIHYYDGSIPNISDRFRGTIIAVDLAVSQKQTADFTAIVCGEYYGYGDDAKLYILPAPVNRRMEYPTTKKLITDIYDELNKLGKSPILVIEDVGTQKGFIQDLKSQGYPVKEFSPGNQDKYSRLWGISEAINSEKVLFPKSGCEQLINQLLNFGLIIQHDDLVDACVMCVSHMITTRNKLVRVFSVKPYPF